MKLFNGIDIIDPWAGKFGPVDDFNYNVTKKIYNSSLVDSARSLLVS